MEVDDLWGPPLDVQDDTLRKQTLRSCEFWFDFRTDVLEENFQNERDCMQVWRLLNQKKKKDVEIPEVDKDLVSISPRIDIASCGSGELHDTSDSDKTLNVIPPDVETSSAKSALDEDDNTSSISDAKTIETRDSSNDTEEVDTETKLKPKETALYDPPTVEVAEDAETTTSSPVLASKIEEADEHSCSSLVTTQVFDPIKQVIENKSSSAISSENVGGTSLLDTGEKVREKANATDEDGEALKDHEESNSLEDIVTASEPFTTESLLELCDEPDKGREMACDERSKKSHPEAVRAVVKDELIINLFNEAKRKAESNTLLNPGLVLTKKRQRDSKGMNTSFIRNTKQNVRGEAGEINTDAVKNSAQSTTPAIIRASSVPTQLSLLELKDGSSQRDGHLVSDSVIPLSTSELKKKTGKELRIIAKALKVTHYYKLKKEDLVQQLTWQLNPS